MTMAIISRLPRKGVLLLSEGLGRAGYYLDRSSRKIGLANLDIAFGDSKTLPQKNKILKASSITMVRTLIDTFWFADNPAERLDQYVDLNDPYLRSDQGKPQILITAHFGNWEIIGQMFAHIGLPISSIATPVKNPTVDKYLVRARESTGQKIIPRKGALRKLLSLLRKNEKTGFLADQNTKESEGGVWVDFFGLPARVTGAPALLSARTGAEIVILFSAPQPRGRYRVYSTTCIPAPIDNEEQTLLEVTKAITLAAENEIRTHPELWLWSYKRWRKIDTPTRSNHYPFYAK